MDLEDQLEKFRNRDRCFLTSIYKSLSESTLGYVIKRGGDQVLAEEVLHEALFRCYSKVNDNLEFKLNKPVTAYVFGFVKIVHLEKARKNLKNLKREKPIDEEDGWRLEKLEDESYRTDFFTKVDDASVVVPLLDELGKGCKDILIAFYVHNESLKSIADELDTTESYVKVKKHRCMKELRDKYNNS